MKVAAILLASILPVFLASCPGKPPQPPPNPGYDCASPPAFAQGQVVPVANAIAGQYIVVLKQRLAVQPLAEVQGVTVTQRYEKGYAARIAQAALARIMADPNVAFVQQDGIKSIPPNEKQTLTATESWGLDRIDQRSGTDGQYDPGADGEGVHAGIIDTGVAPHPDFGDRLSNDCFTAFGTCVDGHGHGTHVAGTIGGTKWGAAKKVSLHAAKVLSDQGSGSDSQVIAGINWFTNKCKDNGWTCVGNMSLGGSSAPALDQAVCDSIAAGVQWAIAAGNENRDADTSSPARVKQAITVGATQQFGDRRASFSNFGVLLDLFAPGVDIESTQPGGGTAIFSGTSMASPHTAGVAVLYRQRHPGATPAEVADGLVAASTKDLVVDPVGSPNRLLYAKED